MSHLHRYNKTQVTVGGGKRDVGKGVGPGVGEKGVGVGNGQKVGNKRPKSTYLSQFLDKYVDTTSRDFSIL